MIEKLLALLDTLNSAELDKLPPAHLRRFSELCRHWHKLAERRPQPQQPKAGAESGQAKPSE
jgi:hypothetical protein